MLRRKSASWLVVTGTQLALKRTRQLVQVEAQHLHVNLARALALLRVQHVLTASGKHFVRQRMQMPTGEFLGRFDDRRLSAEHFPRFGVFHGRQFQRSARGVERVNRVDVGQPLRVAQVQHIQLTFDNDLALDFASAWASSKLANILIFLFPSAK